MVPTIDDQISAIRRCVEKIIAPAIADDQILALEQVTFVLRSLDWLAGIVPHHYRYQVAENHLYRELLQDMVAIADKADDLSEDLEAHRPVADDLPASLRDIPPIDHLERSTRQMKSSAVALIDAAREQGSAALAPLRQTLAGAARRQQSLETSLYAGTGYVKAGQGLDDILAGRRSRPEGVADES